MSRCPNTCVMWQFCSHMVCSLLLMEVGGSWGSEGEVVVRGGSVNGGGSGELSCGGFGHGSWVTTM